MVLKKLLCVGVCLASLAVADSQKVRLTLAEGTIGLGATADWMKIGGDWQLCLAKNVATEEFEAAGADIGGIAGTLAGDLNELCFTIDGGEPGGGSPRWNIYTGPAGTDELTAVTFLGWEAAGEDGCFTDEEIEAALTASGVNLGDQIQYLQIIVDVQGSVYLDDIHVQVGETTTFFKNPNQTMRFGRKALNNPGG